MKTYYAVGKVRTDGSYNSWWRFNTLRQAREKVAKLNFHGKKGFIIWKSVITRMKK